MANRPFIVAFDVIETLMTLEPLRARLEAAGQPPDLLQAWYLRTIRDGMVLSTCGGYADFSDVAAAALRALTRYTIDDAQVTDVMAGFGELPAFPDAVPAMEKLRAAGVRVACLTNGTAALAQSFVERAGLGRFVQRVVSVAEVHRWKPSSIVYHYAAEVLGGPVDRTALVAAHDWDCHGAKNAGLVTGWVSRSSGGYDPVFSPPDVVGADLVEVASALLALPG